MKPKFTSARLLLCLLIGGLVLLYATCVISLQVAENGRKEDGQKVIQWIESERARSGALPASIGIPTRFEWRYHADEYSYRLTTKGYYSARLLLQYDSVTETWEVLHY